MYYVFTDQPVRFEKKDNFFVYKSCFACQLIVPFVPMWTQIWSCCSKYIIMYNFPSPYIVGWIALWFCDHVIILIGWVRIGGIYADPSFINKLLILSVQNITRNTIGSVDNFNTRNAYFIFLGGRGQWWAFKLAIILPQHWVSKMQDAYSMQSYWFRNWTRELSQKSSTHTKTCSSIQQKLVHTRGRWEWRVLF
jgi:hypothetical protein